MMSKKKWLALLCFHICYLFLGASIFYSIENPKETRSLIEKKKHIIVIQKLVHENYLPSNTAAQVELLTKLSDICGEPMAANLSLDDPPRPIWDFYHAFFFSYTVISTIGYGNLAPTTSMGRIIMIFYALLGVPMNAILFANLGAYFAASFRKLYSRYKERNPDQEIDYTLSRYGLIGQIILYLVPGVIIFIFVPACLFVIFEGWDYTLAVYYAFVTLTTIGFGDYVAAVQDNGYGIYFQLYKAFLIFWITFGLGYIGMCIGFLTQGLRSKKVRELKEKLSKNLKVTQSKIWNGVSRDVGYLRKILNEISIMRYTPVYRDEVPVPKLHRASSCPSFTLDRESPNARRRANSEMRPGVQMAEINRTQSDTDLLAIDRNRTFETTQVQPIELLARVVDALGSIQSEDVDEYSEKGVHGFSDSQILESEKMGSDWSIGESRIFTDSPPSPRTRAASEIRVPTSFEDNKAYANGDWNWSGSTSSDKLKEQLAKLRKGQKLSMPNVSLSEEQMPHSTAGNILSRLNPFKRKGSKPTDLESDRIMPPDYDAMTPEDYLKKTSRGRFSLAPPSLLSQKFLNKSDNDMTPEEYLKKTSRGRFSMIPSSARPQKFLSASNNEMTPEDYLKKTARGRFSMAPVLSRQQRISSTTSNDMTPEDYLKRTARGRFSVAVQPQRYLNGTKSGRSSRISTSSDKADVLEQTTLADLIRAIEALHSGEAPELPKRKVGTVTPPGTANPLLTLSQPSSNRGRRLSLYSPMSIPNVEMKHHPSIPSALPPAASRRRLSLFPSSDSPPSFTSTMSPLALDGGKRDRSSSALMPPPYSSSDALRKRALGGATRRMSMITAVPSLRLRRNMIAPTITENIPLTRTRDLSLPDIKIDRSSDTKLDIVPESDTGKPSRISNEVPEIKIDKPDS